MNAVKDFLLSIISNIHEDYLEITLITSRTQGKLTSIQRPFGVGKSTLAFYLSFLLHKVAHEGIEAMFDPDIGDMRVWAEVFDHAAYTLDEVIDIITHTEERIPCIVWDDAQLTAPAVTHITKEMKEKIEYLSIARPFVANIIMTAPNISELAKPLRKLVSYELIVPERGRYEVQRIVRRKNFYAPTKDYERMLYLSDGVFPPFPPEVQRMYDEWRRKHTKIRGFIILSASKARGLQGTAPL